MGIWEMDVVEEYESELPPGLSPHTLSVVVDNVSGVLDRVTGVIARRGYNIQVNTHTAPADPLAFASKQVPKPWYEWTIFSRTFSHEMGSYRYVRVVRVPARTEPRGRASQSLAVGPSERRGVSRITMVSCHLPHPHHTLLAPWALFQRCARTSTLCFA